MKWLRAVGVVVLALVVLAAAAYVARARRGAAHPLATMLSRTDGRASEPRAARGARVRVQVLNTTRTRGLAKRATRMLRAQGFDVVEIGTTAPAIDTTLVLDRSGHPEWAAAVAATLSPSRAVARPDSSRYLDVTVLLGRSWRPPAQPLDP